jgi:flagellar motor switch protein FliG
MPDNFFINKYKKNNSNNPKKENEKSSETNNYVFEKIEKKSKKIIPRKRLAAMFLILVGPDKAKDIIKTFNEEELIKITNEMINIDSISDDDILEVESAFGNITKNNNILKGGKEFTRNLLQNAFGIEKGSSYFIKCIEETNEKELSFIDSLHPEEIKNILEDESDIVITVILGMIDPKKAAKVLSLLPKEVTIQVIKKMSGKLEIPKDVYEVIINKMKEKISFLKDDETIKISGKSKLVEILKYSDNTQSEKIIQDIEEVNPELANEIKENIFTFNDIALLTRKDLEKALKIFPDKDIAFILKGAKDEMKAVFFTCMTKRRKEIIIDEMEVLGSVKKKDVDEKRRSFIHYLKELEDNSKISLKPDKDIYIE